MKIRILSSHSFVRSQHKISSKRLWLLTAVFMLVTVIGKLTAQPLTSNQATVQPASVENKEEDKPKVDPDTLDKYFFIGHVGGNINFVDRNLNVNSIYTDIQFRPRLQLTKRIGISLPIRIYYNNGSGPLQSGPDSQSALTASASELRVVTVDTVTLAPKIRYWNDNLLLTNKTEQRNLGLNIPILCTFSIGDENPNWHLTAGVNLDFMWVTNRLYDYQYSPATADTARFYVTNSRSQIPVVSPYVVNAFSTYGTTPFRPEAPVNRSYDYAQIFTGFQVGLEHYSKAYNFSLRYSIGGISSYATRLYNSINTYNQVFQLIFLEKKLGIQFLGEIRANSSDQAVSRSNINTSIPYYYFSLSKTIYLSRIKEIFFP